MTNKTNIMDRQTVYNSVTCLECDETIVKEIEYRKPIHKLNNGRGATLCHKCSVIISVGLTDDLYCDSCTQQNIPKSGTNCEDELNKSE